MKKALTLLIAVIMVIGLFSGCTKDVTTPLGTLTKEEIKELNKKAGGLELPIDTEGTVINMFASTDNTGLTDKLVFKELSRRTGLNLQVTEAPKSTSKDKIKILIASKDQMPDIAVVSDTTLLNDVGMQGGFVNVLKYKDSLPNFKRIFIDEAEKLGTTRILKSQVAPDGGLYYFPSYDVQRDVNHGMLYRKDIFDKNGIKMWNNPEEFYQALKKLKELYPDSTPLVTKTGATFFNQLAQSWGVIGWPAASYNFDTDTWDYSTLQPQFKDFIAYVKKLYDEKLLDPEFVTCTQASWTQKMAQADKAFCTFDWIGRLDQFVNQSKDSVEGYDLRYGNPVGPTGKVITLSRSWSYTVAIKAGAKEEKILKLCDYLLSEGGSELVNLGVEGVSYDLNEDGTKAIYKLAEGETMDENTMEEKWGISSFILNRRGDRRGWEFQFTEREQEAQDLMKGKEDGFLPEQPELVFTSEEKEIIAKYDTNLRKISEEFVIKFVLSNDKEPDWDGFMKKMKQAGYDEVMNCYKAAHSRYNSK